MSPDLAARQVLVGCYLYYVLDDPHLDDFTYDALTRLVAERWSEIDPVRQWQLGSPADILATGHHVKFTMATVYAARDLYKSKHGRPAPLAPPRPELWRRNEQHGVYYTTTMGTV